MLLFCLLFLKTNWMQKSRKKENKLPIFLVVDDNFKKIMWLVFASMKKSYEKKFNFKSYISLQGSTSTTKLQGHF